MTRHSCFGLVFARRSNLAACLCIKHPPLLRTLAASALCLLMLGCATPGLDSSYQPKGNDAIIVMGTEGLSQVDITPGRSDGTTWRFKKGFSNRHIVNIREGFVVVRLDPTTDRLRYGVFQINGSITQSANVATFTAEAGTVTYIGTLAVKTEEVQSPLGWVWETLMRKKWDPDGAAEYLRKYYPELAPKLRCLPAIEFQKNRFVIF